MFENNTQNLPTLLDAYCCAGGATRGFQLAGCYVVGVDIAPQPHYIGDEFYRADALTFIKEHGHRFDVRAGSPPCQARTNAQKIRQREHPRLIGPTRDLFLEIGGPYVIENVVPMAGVDDEDPLLNPFELCGCMFPELNVYRTRQFESNVDLERPAHREHRERQTKMGRPFVPGERMHVVGNFSGVPHARKAMGIDWMVRDELSEAIPPAYTKFIGDQIIKKVR